MLKLHSLPSIQLKVASAIATVNHRTVGVPTGSRSDAVAGRIPLIYVARICAEELSKRGFKTNDLRTSLGTHVDSICSVAHSAGSAIWILEDLEYSRIERWDLVDGADSKDLLIPNNSPEDLVHKDGCTKVSTMQILGHSLDNDSGGGDLMLQ